jgi:hypothetical protein
MKNLSIKVYTNNGTFLKDWASIANFSGFSKEINSGLGECIIELLVQIDYLGADLAENNRVDILISDKDTSTDGFVKIYSGYISLIEPSVDGSKESVLVHLLGHYTKLSTDFLKNGSQITLYSDNTNGLTTTASGTSADLGLILRGILDRYIAETENPNVFYSSVSIPLVSQTALYSLSLKTYREAIDSVCSMLPSGYFWFVDEEGMIYIKPKPTTPTHTFQFGKHFKSIKISKSMEKIRNFLLIWNGDPSGSAIFKYYSDEASIKKYGRRSDFIQDNGITDTSSADKMGAKYIAENKDPSIKLTCEILDNNFDDVNGYNIESIQVGNTCKFINFNSSITDILNDNMLITKVDYLFDRVILEIELIKTGIVDIQNKTTKQVTELKAQGIPATYS